MELIQPLLDLINSIGWCQALAVLQLAALVALWRRLDKAQKVINDLQEKRIQDFERVLTLAEEAKKLAGVSDEDH